MLHIIGNRASGKTIQLIFNAKLRLDIENDRLKEKETPKRCLFVGATEEYLKHDFKELYPDIAKSSALFEFTDYSNLYCHPERYTGGNYLIYIDDLDAFNAFVREKSAKSKATGSIDLKVLNTLLKTSLKGYTSSDTNALKDLLYEVLHEIAFQTDNRYIFLSRGM